MPNKKIIQLKNPPIKEAVFAVFYSLEDDFDINNFDSFINKVNTEFTKKEEISSFETKLEVGNPTPITKHEKNGYLLLNDDKTKAIQLRKNGFMYSITQQSYISWDEFKKDAWVYLNDIIKLYNIKEVSKLSLRYINSINLPTTISDIKEYILIAPDIPDELNYGINRMFLQMVLPNTNDSVGIVTQNFNIGRELSETFSYIIDIDVSITKNRSIKDIDGIKSDFDNLRAFKNEIFFKSITDKTIELFKK